MVELHEYRTAGRSGLRVSPLTLGTMTFGDAGWGSDAETGVHPRPQPLTPSSPVEADKESSLEGVCPPLIFDINRDVKFTRVPGFGRHMVDR
ncbi:hypothetical protein [Actinoplanes subtropicus]|uniref:hypothetical protein n=1 Tax=Actinoplanes subtropicus TaxID=543632 RepID=UPI0012F75603|nr:hypothetical protein [Actinoplanes subtropicus]